MTNIDPILAQTETFILAGGRGERLAPLTRDCAKPAVYFGNCRIIDFTLSNCLQSSISRPFILTQYRASHLQRQVRQRWLHHTTPETDARVAPVCVPAPKRDYLGTADALFRNIPRLDPSTRHVLALSADHIYNMDYRVLLQCHRERDADVTVSSIVYPRERAGQFGILEVDAAERITGFEEKPFHPRPLPGQPGKVLANMGIYVFRREVFLEALQRDAIDPDSVHDIGRNVLPDVLRRRVMYAFRFENRETGEPGYWKDVGTLDSYYEASMEWLESKSNRRHFREVRSVIADGVRIHPTAEIVDSVVLPGVEIGPGARIRRAILDERVRVLRNARIGDDCAGNGT